MKKEEAKKIITSLDILSLNRDLHAFNQIYKDAKNFKTNSLKKFLDYYKKLRTKYTAMQENGEVVITLNSRHDYLNPNHDTSKILFEEKYKELANHNIAKILGLEEVVAKPGSTYPKKIKIILSKDNLELLKKVAPGICREYETFLKNKKAVLGKKIKRIEDIFSTIYKLNKKISKAKNSVMLPLADYIDTYLDYYNKYKETLEADRELCLANEILKLPNGNFIFTKESTQNDEQIKLKAKLLSLIDKSEKRVDRVIYCLEKIKANISPASKKGKSRPN